MRILSIVIAIALAVIGGMLLRYYVTRARSKPPEQHWVHMRRASSLCEQRRSDWLLQAVFEGPAMAT